MEYRFTIEFRTFMLTILIMCASITCYTFTSNARIKVQGLRMNQVLALVMGAEGITHALIEQDKFITV